MLKRNLPSSFARYFLRPHKSGQKEKKDMAKKKNFDTKKEALDHVRDSIGRLTGDSGTGYRSDEFKDALGIVLRTVCDSKTKDQAVKTLAKLTSGREGRSSPMYYSRSWGNGTEKLLDTMEVDRWDTEKATFYDRPFVNIAGRETHLLELNEDLTQSDWSEIAVATKCNMMDELIYEYAVTVGDHAMARKIASSFIEINEGRGPVVSSDRIEDYEPFMAVVKAKRIPASQRWVQDTATNYMRAFYAANRPASQGLNDRMMSEYREYFKATKYTKFGLEAKRGQDDKNSVIDDFDILESNSTARKELFTQSSYELNRKLRDMAERDEARLARIAAKHLNAEHPNGVRKSSFLRTYRRIADVVKIDPMELNTKLQSYVLLEEIN